MVQKLIAFSEGKNDPRDLLLFFIITFFHFIILNSLKWPVQPGCYYCSANYTASRSRLQWNCVECLFLFVYLLHTYSMCLVLGVYWWTTDTNWYCETKYGENLPAMQVTRVWFLGWEEPLEKQMATHSSFLGWEISWTEEPGALESMGLQRVRHDLVTKKQP